MNREGIQRREVAERCPFSQKAESDFTKGDDPKQKPEKIVKEEGTCVCDQHYHHLNRENSVKHRDSKRNGDINSFLAKHHLGIGKSINPEQDSGELPSRGTPDSRTRTSHQQRQLFHSEQEGRFSLPLQQYRAPVSGSSGIRNILPSGRYQHEEKIRISLLHHAPRQRKRRHSFCQKNSILLRPPFMATPFGRSKMLTVPGIDHIADCTTTKSRRGARSSSRPSLAAPIIGYKYNGLRKNHRSAIAGSSMISTTPLISTEATPERKSTIGTVGLSRQCAVDESLQNSSSLPIISSAGSVVASPHALDQETSMSHGLFNEGYRMTGLFAQHARSFQPARNGTTSEEAGTQNGACLRDNDSTSSIEFPIAHYQHEQLVNRSLLRSTRMLSWLEAQESNLKTSQQQQLEEYAKPHDEIEHLMLLQERHNQTSQLNNSIRLFPTSMSSLPHLSIAMDNTTAMSEQGLSLSSSMATKAIEKKGIGGGGSQRRDGSSFDSTVGRNVLSHHVEEAQYTALNQVEIKEMLPRCSHADIHPFYQRSSGVPLATDEDHNWLSEFLCFVRSDLVEYFPASQEDVLSRNSSKKVVHGQVGIRCRFCSQLPPSARATRSSSYPRTISRIYQSLTMMLRDHFPNCTHIPISLKQRFQQLKAKAMQGATGSNHFWEYSARKVGLKDSEVGIWIDVETEDPQRPILDTFSADSSQATQEQTKIIARKTPLAERLGDHSRPLISKEDVGLVPDHLFVLMSDHVQLIFLDESEKVGNRKNLPVGLPGIGCRHCCQMDRMGFCRVFPASKRTLPGKIDDLAEHVLRCRLCPRERQDELKVLKSFEGQRNETRTASGSREFYDRIWARMRQRSSRGA